MSRNKKPPDKIWYPTLLQTANNINTHSWFDIKQKNNTDKLLNNKLNIKTDFSRTIKYIIYPNNNQKAKLKLFFHTVIKMYNITNKYLKNKLKYNKKLDSFFTIRKKLNIYANNLIKKTGVQKHTLDYAIKHCIEMYKSALSNLKNKNIKTFDIKNMSYTKNRYNLVIEPNNFSKKNNGFFTTQLGEMKSQKPLKNITHNCVLQYNRNSNKYYVLVLQDCEMQYEAKRESKCGIDLGVRTFATVYSNNKTLEIGSNTNKQIDKYNKKIDKIKSHFEQKTATKKQYDKVIYKYGNKLRNKIDDMHKKVSERLATNYEIINLGKISTSNVISNERKTIKDITKRRAVALKFYKFTEILKVIAKKYNCKIVLIDEYNTSKECHNCKNKNDDLGGQKIYSCKTCKVELDRDVNASINIYNRK
jgi:putative transposase